MRRKHNNSTASTDRPRGYAMPCVLLLLCCMWSEKGRTAWPYLRVLLCVRYVVLYFERTIYKLSCTRRRRLLIECRRIEPSHRTARFSRRIKHAYGGSCPTRCCAVVAMTTTAECVIYLCLTFVFFQKSSLCSCGATAVPSRPKENRKHTHTHTSLPKVHHNNCKSQ